MNKTLSNFFPYAMLFCLVVMWGSAFAALKISLETISPLNVMSLRLIIGSIRILLFFLILNKKLPISLNFWLWSLLIGFLGLSLPFSIIAWGAQFISSSLVAILMGINPIITLILSYILLKDRSFNLRIIFGIFSGLFGIILLVGLNSIYNLTINDNFFIGQIAVLGGTFSFALASVIIKNAPTENSFERSLSSLICGSIIGLLIVYFSGDRSLSYAQISIKSITSLILLGVFPTGIATLLWFKIISLKGPLFLSLVNYLIPVWALFIGIFFLNEKINFVIGFGLIFITMGIWLIEKR